VRIPIYDSLLIMIIGCLHFSFSVKGNFGNQMMYSQSAFTNSKPIIKIVF
jgi:hypothetical protein